MSAREHGSNKQVASKNCALSLLRQLFHLGEVEAYTGEKKKKKESEVGGISGLNASNIFYLPHFRYHAFFFFFNVHVLVLNIEENCAEIHLAYW